MAAQPGEVKDELSKLEAEWGRLYDEWSRLILEVGELERRLKESKQDEEKKKIEGQLKKAIARRDLARAEESKAYCLWKQRVNEKDRAELVIKSGDTSEVVSEIRRWKDAVVEWEEKIIQRQQLLLEIEQDEVFKVTKIEGYTCVGRSVLCLVYLPDTVSHINVNIQSVSDSTVYPKTSANDIMLTPVVSITSQSQTLAMDKPVVIELMKTAEVDAVGDNKIVPMFSDTDDSIPPNWEDLHKECEVLDDRFRFKTTHFTYFAVVARFSPPTASVMVDPEIDFDHELTVPELPGFSVTIPPKSVPSPIEAKATLYYDESDEMKGSANERLASACVRLEPEGQMFSGMVSVSLPIPGYSEIIAANPGAKPQLMCSPSGSSNNWEIYEDMEIVKVDGEFVAQFSTNHFSYWRLSWAENIQGVAKAVGTIFKRVKSLCCRCQMFMSRETEVGSVVNFSVQGLVYQFQDPPQEIPCNYRYILHDSGTLPIRVPPGELSFTLELKKYLILDKKDKVRFQKIRPLTHDSSARPKFDIDLNKKSKTRLKEGAVIANFSVSNNDGLVYECDLIKPSQMEESDNQVPPSDVKTISSEVNKAVKSGQITDPDRLFNEISVEICQKYTEIGISLGLAGNMLTNELETGEMRMLQGSRKALKMLQLWRESVKEDDLTYSVLAAALEKNGFGHCAHTYCYNHIGDESSSDKSTDLETSETTCQDIICEQEESSVSPSVTDKVVEKRNKCCIGTTNGAGPTDSGLVNTEVTKRVTDHEEPPTIGRRISRWCSCNCFK